MDTAAPITIPPVRVADAQDTSRGGRTRSEARETPFARAERQA
jgi:hypothetical protein